jgi:GNAT superfamily N-acetyltransferase
MTAPLDPMQGLAARQMALQQGSLNLRPATTHPRLLACARSDDAGPVLSYIVLEDSQVTAMVNFRPRMPVVDEVPAYNIELAVHEDRRGGGRGKEAVGAALLELRHELARAGVYAFDIEAIVETNNPASMHIAEETICENAVQTTDQYSGKRAFRYLRRLESPARPPEA